MYLREHNLANLRRVPAAGDHGLQQAVPAHMLARGIAVWKRSGRAGFTLIDVMVTVALIAILTAGGALMITGALGSYQRNGARRQILSAVREAQSLAIARGFVVYLQWGGATGVNRPLSQYRIVRDSTGGCSIPAVAAAVDGTNVIRGWTDLASGYAGTSIQSITDPASHTLGGVMFNSLGASVNTCTTVSFPVSVRVLDGRGTIQTITVQSAGGATLP